MAQQFGHFCQWYTHEGEMIDLFEEQGGHPLFCSECFIRDTTLHSSTNAQRESGYGRVPVAAPPLPAPTKEPESGATPFPTGASSLSSDFPFPTASKG